MEDIKKQLLMLHNKLAKKRTELKMIRDTRATRVSNRIGNRVNVKNFAICCFSLINDLNIHMIYRNLACFNGLEMFVVGSEEWFKGATNGLKEHIPISYFSTPSEFLSHTKESGYKLVAVEQSNNSIPLSEAEYDPNDKICFVVGNESFGLTDEILLNSELVVEIPQDGIHPCLNVSVASGIVMYDYLSKR